MRRSFSLGGAGLWGRALLLVVLALGLAMGQQQVRGQAVEDTSEARPTGVEPADLDSLPTRDVSPTLPSDTAQVEQAFVNADSLSTLQRGGERLQELFGNVFVQQDTTRLRSQYALRYLNRDELLFVNDVVIYERGDTLRADTVRYDRATEVGRARGNVRLTNGEVKVRADRATYYSQEKRSVFPDSVVLVDSTRILRARYGTYWSDEERAEFGGGVQLTEPGTRLRADSLTYYRAQDRSLARGRVFVDRYETNEGRTDTTARTYLFGEWVDNREARRYSRVQGNALLIRVGLDSTGAATDSLLVKARRLEAFRTDTHRRLVAVEDVRIWQPDLSAVADSAVYDQVVAPIADSASGSVVAIDTARPPPDSLALAARTQSSGPLAQASPSKDSAQADSTRGRAEPPRTAAGKEEPAVPGDTARAAGPPADSVRTTAEGGPPPPADSMAQGQGPPPAASARRRRSGGGAAPQGLRREWTTPVARADSALPLEETRLFRSPVTWFEKSQVWGDSIRVRARNRQPDTVFVRGAAFAAQRDPVLDRIQQLKANTIVAYFREGGLHRIRAQPTAEAIRFLAAQNDSLNGAARTSGDRIILRFRDGSVRRISVVGGTKSTYYRKNENIPDPFELDGFQWTPKRRPTRAGVLHDPRVRRRLDIELPPPSRRGTGPVPEGRPHSGVPPDTTAVPRSDSLRRERTVPLDSTSPIRPPGVPPDTSASMRNPDS